LGVKYKEYIHKDFKSEPLKLKSMNVDVGKSLELNLHLNYSDLLNRFKL